MKKTLFFMLLILIVVPAQGAYTDDFYNIFSDSPINKESFSSDWNSQNLNIFPTEIPVSCNGDTRVMELNKIRVLYAFFYTDHILENNSLQEIDLNTITASEWNEAFFIAIKSIRTQRLNYELMISTLIEYHDKITNTPGWGKKLNSFMSENKSPDPFDNQGEGFYAIGFSKDACFSESSIAGHIEGTDVDRTYVDIKVNLEIALYSFWYRRYVDGSMGTIYRFLSRIKKSKSELNRI